MRKIVIIFEFHDESMFPIFVVKFTTFQVTELFRYSLRNNNNQTAGEIKRYIEHRLGCK